MKLNEFRFYIFTALLKTCWCSMSSLMQVWLIITLHYTTLQYYITLHYTTLHYITLHYTTLHYITLYYTTLHHIHYITPHSLHSLLTLHYFQILSHHVMLYHAMLFHGMSHHIMSHYVMSHNVVR